MPVREPALTGDPLADLAVTLEGRSPEWLTRFLEGLDPADLDVVELALARLRHQRWVPLPHQVPPDPADPTWLTWLLLAGRGSGKRLAVDTPLPTPTGWTTMGDVDVGDRLFDATGRPCTVTYVSPVVLGDSYEIEFTDGSTITADAGHRWLTWDKAARKSAGRRKGNDGRGWPRARSFPSVRTTAEIAATLMVDKERNHSIRNTEPLDLPDADLQVDPYVLGVWLGDGNSRSGLICAGDQDGDETTAHLRATGVDVYPLTRDPARSQMYRVVGLTEALRRLGVLRDKHIPDRYLRASRAQRLALLQGLMDTDGGWSGAQAEIALTLEGLARGCYELVVSLGMKASWSKRPAKLYGIEHGTAYRVRFTPTLPVFRLARKLDRQRFDTAQQQRRVHRYVAAVRKVPDVAMRCIAVDSPAHLYLAGPAMIPTHNTDACAHAMDAHAKGPPCLPHLPGGHRMAIIAPTLGDASDACVNGPSGLRVHDPGIIERTRKGGTSVIWPHGAEAKLFGAYTKQDVERLRAGGNRCFVWCEELAAWRYLRASWNHMRLGLRLGQHPRVIASTTPKNRPHLRRIMDRADTRLSRAHTRDNPHLAAGVRAELLATYEHTRLGRQELAGLIVDDVEGALWSEQLIDEHRREGTEVPGRWRRIVVGVDPSWGSTNDECGIVVAGLGWDGHGYVLADYSVRGGPLSWVQNVADAFWTHQADIVVAEGNFQGEQVRLAMLQVDHPMGRPPFKLINASRGKALRATPVVLLYERGMVHHAGRLPVLEAQMCTWVPGEPTEDDDDEPDLGAPDVGEHEGSDDVVLASSWSPDRIDALVFALTDLMVTDMGPAGVHRPSMTATGPRTRRPRTPPAVRRTRVQ